MEGVGITINTLGSSGGKMGSVGKPLNTLELKIVDSTGKKLLSGPDNIGEIIVKSKTNNTFEYYKQPKVSDVRIDEQGWVYTGDFGYVDNENYLFFMGKKNDIINRAGEMIYLKEIERLTNSHPSVYTSACFPLLNDSKSKTNMLLKVVKVKNSSITPKKLSDYLYHNLAYYHVPRFIGFLEHLPISPTTEYLRNEIKNEWEEIGGNKKIWDNQLQHYIES